MNPSTRPQRCVGRSTTGSACASPWLWLCCSSRAMARSMTGSISSAGNPEKMAPATKPATTEALRIDPSVSIGLPSHARTLHFPETSGQEWPRVNSLSHTGHPASATSAVSGLVRGLMAREARRVPGVMNQFVNEVCIKGVGPLDPGQQPPLVKGQRIPREETQHHQPYQHPRLWPDHAQCLEHFSLPPLSV